MMPRSLYAIFAFLITWLSAFSGTRYRTGPDKELPLLLGAAAFTGASFAAQAGVMPPDTLKLNRHSIFQPDRWAAGLHHPFPARVSDCTASGSLILPLIAFSQVSRSDVPDGLIVYLEALVFTRAVVYLCKGAFQRPRPYAYRPGSGGSVSRDRDAAQSFLSGHTAAAFCGAVFAACMADSRMIPSRWKYPVICTGLSLASATAFLRVASGKHFPTDVLAGAAAGSLIAWSLSRMHETSGGTESRIPQIPVLKLQILF